MDEFKDKVAVITSAASGIGPVIAEKFGQEGMKVVISGIEEEALSQTEVELKGIRFDVLALTTDVSKFEDVRNLDLYSYAKFV